MANDILYGIAFPEFTTTGLTPNRLFPVEPIGISIEGEAESIESTKFLSTGKTGTAGSIAIGETFTMTVTIEAINWMVLQFAYGELAQVKASGTFPQLKYATVPSASPYEITDTDITANVIATTLGSDALFLTNVADAPDAAGEMQVITTPTKKLVFHSTEAGKQLAYRIADKTFTNLRSLGASDVYTTFSSFSYSGIVKQGDKDYRIVIPSCQKTGIPTLEFAGEVVSMELTFNLVTPAGRPRPFELYELP